MNKVIGIFGVQGTGKTSYCIKYIYDNYKQYEYIWVFSPLTILNVNDLFILKLKKFYVDKMGKYSIFKVLDIDREKLMLLQRLDGKKLLIIDEIDLFFNIQSSKEDFMILTTLRNNNCDILYTSKRVKRIPLLLLHMTNKLVFFKYNLLRDLEDIKEELRIENLIDVIMNLKEFEYVEIDR